MDYMYVDIETCPISLEGYDLKTEEEKQKLISPIDSKIVAIGLKQVNKEPILLLDSNEKKMLEEFWIEFATFRKGDSTNKIVGFNIRSFDVPFLVTRSFFNNVKIAPFAMKDIVDIREYTNCFRTERSRGTLKDFGKGVGITEMEDMDGSKVANCCINKDFDKLKQYLSKDLEMTEGVHKRIMELNMDKVSRQWW